MTSVRSRRQPVSVARPFGQVRRPSDAASGACSGGVPGAAPLTGKPVALMGASPSQVGTARAQLHLRLLLGHVHARTLPPPELLVAAAHERFDRELQLRHEGTRRVLAALLERFAHWIDRERAADAAERALALPASAQR